MISARTIAEVKERTDLVALVSEHVPSLKLRGRSFTGLCPFHSEKTPSFHVNRERAFYHCFGCKESGGAIDFLMKLEGHTFPEAVRDLAERAGITVEDDENPEQRKDYERKRREAQDLYQVMNLAALFYETQLREHESREYAIDELRGRGLVPIAAGGTDPKVQEALDAFRMGYAPHGWDELAKYLKAQGVAAMDAERAGLLLPRSSGSGHYDRFRHRLMFAVTDTHGRVVAFSGRALKPLPGSPEGTDKPAKYINSPETPIYTKGNELFGVFQGRHEIRKAGVALVVEGNFDVVALHARGFANTVAPLGTAFTPEQAKLLKRFATQVTLVFDGDAAGQKATVAAREPLRAAGLTAKVAVLPAGQDPDSLVRERGVEALKALLASARGLRETLVERALDETFSQADVFEKKSRIDAVLKILTEEDDPLIRATLKTLADELAGRFDIREGDAFRALEHTVRKAMQTAPLHPQGSPPGSARVRKKPRGSLERAAIIGALLDFPALLDDPEVGPALALLEGLSTQTAATLRRHRNNGEIVDVSTFLQELPQETRAFVSGRLAQPEHSSLKDAKGNLLDNAEQLRSRLSADEHDEMVRQQRRLGGDFEAESHLAAQASEQARRKHNIKT